MIATVYSDGVGNRVVGVYEGSHEVCALIVPDWCGTSPVEALKGFRNGGNPPWIQILGAEEYRSLQGKLSAPEGTFEVEDG